ncbi:MAG: hypothetical protein ACREJX_07490, partial [Polyangiaceae bacterium]
MSGPIPAPAPSSSQIPVAAPAPVVSEKVNEKPSEKANGDKPPPSTSMPAQPSSGSLIVTSSGETIDLRASSLYLNRELSWIEFNARVLAEADNDAVPL